MAPRTKQPVVDVDKLLAPLAAHADWRGMMNKDIARDVVNGDADPRAAADFILARAIAKAQRQQGGENG